MRTFLLLFTIAIILLAAQAGAAQSAQRIQFAKGKSSATVRANTGSYGTAYVVRARSGQKIVLTLTPSSGVGIKVENEGRFGHQVLLREESGGTFEVGLEESGDYTIFVGSTRGRPSPVTLTVTITKLAEI